MTAFKEITYQGQTMTVGAWAKKIGMTRKNLDARVFRYGWGLDRALGTPTARHGGPPKKTHCANGHALKSGNLLWSKWNGLWRRQCATCSKAWKNEYQKRWINTAAGKRYRNSKKRKDAQKKWTSQWRSSAKGQDYKLLRVLHIPLSVMTEDVRSMMRRYIQLRRELRK